MAQALGTRPWAWAPFCLYWSPCHPCPVSISGCEAPGVGRPWVTPPLVLQRVWCLVHRSLQHLHKARECGQRPRVWELEGPSGSWGVRSRIGKGEQVGGVVSSAALAPSSQNCPPRLLCGPAPPCLLGPAEAPWGAPRGRGERGTGGAAAASPCFMSFASLSSAWLLGTLEVGALETAAKTRMRNIGFELG